MLLALRDVGKVWLIERTGERVNALESITLDVAPGEFLILLGPSGCGKSTLLQIIAGLEAPSSGEIRFPSVTRGVSPCAKPNGKLTSMVFQDYALFPWRTVMGNIVFGPEVRRVARGEREERARRLIELVNLKGAEDRYPHELSGGMRQRVAPARGRAHAPTGRGAGKGMGGVCCGGSRWRRSTRRRGACSRTSSCASGARPARPSSTSRTACRRRCSSAAASSS